MEKSKIRALFDLAARPLLHPLPSHLLLESQSSGGAQGTHICHPTASARISRGWGAPLGPGDISPPGWVLCGAACPHALPWQGQLPTCRDLKCSQGVQAQ